MFLGVVDENSCIIAFLSFRFLFHKARTVSAMVISQLQMEREKECERAL